MKRDRVQLWLAVCVLFFQSAVVNAQPRILSPQNRATAAPNPLYEKAKTDAQDAHGKGDYERAIELTSGVLRFSPRDDVAYYLRASARVELGQSRGDAKLVREGVSDAREAISITRAENVNYYLPYLYGMTTLATVEDRKTHAEVAVRIAGELLDRPALKPDERANILYQRAIAYAFLNDLEQTIADHKAAIKAVPEHFGSGIALAHAYAATGDQQKATESFGDLVKAFPNSPQVYNDRGNYLQEIGRAEAAIADFTRAVELDPGFSVAYINRGFSLLSSGQAESAQVDFTAALKIDQNQPMVYNLRGDSLLAQRRLEPAIADYNYATQLDPQNPTSFANLGFARFLARDYGGAATAFDSAVKRDPQQRYLNAWKAWALVLSGKTDAASEEFDSVLKKDAAERDWIDRLIAHAVGKIGNEELLNSVDKSDKRIEVSQACEAQFFIGRKLALDGQAEQAATHFQNSLKTAQRHLYAFRAAAYELNDNATSRSPGKE